MQNIKSIISKEFPSVVIPLIKEAKESIDIIVYDWRFYKNDPACSVSLFNSAIIDKCKKGVRVRCVVNSEAIKQTLNLLGCQARVLNTEKVLHTKLMIIDKKTVILGSHNYTQHAFTANFELSVCFDLETQENDFVKYFNNLYGL